MPHIYIVLNQNDGVYGILSPDLCLIIFRYNTFSPDIVKKMPKKDLADEVKTIF